MSSHGGAVPSGIEVLNALSNGEKDVDSPPVITLYLKDTNSNCAFFENDNNNNNNNTSNSQSSKPNNVRRLQSAATEYGRGKGIGPSPTTPSSSEWSGTDNDENKFKAEIQGETDRFQLNEIVWSITHE